MLLRHLIPLGALGWLAAGCGAFADAARTDAGDGGAEPVDSNLSFFVGEVERETLRQGKVEQFRIVFDTPPPWTPGEGDEVFITRFEFWQGGELLEDYNHVPTSNNGVDTWDVILGADRHARTGERRLYLDIAYTSFGHPQRIYRGSGPFFILPALDVPDGGDGDGGADGGGP
ncbi:MAG TPA: hypothetical protein PK668_21330 [Myxococcota bacterium]|nr:hypothetical protein [Myxococcota bacterium]HRY96019.1 hypothetical protein [Myxococcota bacterium]HSA23009.1 hypothetical protein [Myxococcota bacterium]